MKNKIKIDVSGDGWKTIEQANEQIDTLQKVIVSFREFGMDIDFRAVEEARKIRDKLFKRPTLAEYTEQAKRNFREAGVAVPTNPEFYKNAYEDTFSSANSPVLASEERG